jgi:hypothetical protein
VNRALACENYEKWKFFLQAKGGSYFKQGFFFVLIETSQLTCAMSSFLSFMFSATCKLKNKSAKRDE